MLDVLDRETQQSVWHPEWQLHLGVGLCKLGLSSCPSAQGSPTLQKRCCATWGGLWLWLWSLPWLHVTLQQTTQNPNGNPSQTFFCCDLHTRETKNSVLLPANLAFAYPPQARGCGTSKCWLEKSLNCRVLINSTSRLLKKMDKESCFSLS